MEATRRKHPPKKDEDLFVQFDCDSCHGTGHANDARRSGNLYGKQEQLANGQSVLVDEAYIRESILDPKAKIVARLRAGDAQFSRPGYGGTDSGADCLCEITCTGAIRTTGEGTTMSTEQIVVTREHYLNCSFGWKSWLLTTDHKRIGLLYLISITFFFFLGGAFATLIRLELLTPQGDLFQAETYNKLFTMHGIMMVFFFLIPSIPACSGNFLIPLMIGARDLAFPRLNLLSWYLFMIGGLLTLCAIVAGGVDTGWTFYTPYSTPIRNTHVVLTVVGIFIAGFSSILTGLNFIVTIHTHARART